MLDSVHSVLCELDEGIQFEVVAVGAVIEGAEGRRLKVIVGSHNEGKALQHEGWISTHSEDGRALIDDRPPTGTQAEPLH